MKVFLSWSKTLSHDVAKEFADWLPNVIQACQAPFHSSETSKGDAWFGTIMQRLQESAAGVAFVTRENAREQWVNFEAGAMFSKFGAKLYPVLVDVSKADYAGPLKNLQITDLTDKDDMLLLMKSINEQVNGALPEERLVRAFEKYWEEFHIAVKKAIAASSEVAPEPSRTIEDKVDEILLAVRALGSRPDRRVGDLVNSRVVNDILGRTGKISVKELREQGLERYKAIYPKNSFVIRDGSVAGEVVGAIPINDDWFLQITPIYSDSGVNPFQAMASTLEFSDTPF